MNSALPYFLYYGKAEKPLRILIDTGSNKNFIHPKFAKISHDVKKPFSVSSVGGDLKITKYSMGKFFRPYSELDVKFFHMDKLKSFDAIIGHDTLKELKAVIDTSKEKLILEGNFVIPLLQYKLQEVNKINIRNEHLEEHQKSELEKILKDYQDLLQPPDEKLPFTTKIKADIRTTDDNPIYSKSYPYPQALKTEVNRQIEKLLNDGIIRPSRSPYNSPVWIVPKKLDASNERKYRMVIDYRKLNSKTISDRYPIPDTSAVLSNLGANNFFTTLDLASGFHQIPMSEKDIEKTAFSVNNGKYEFVRLPFGLKNAPSIFQRVMDDILRDHLGKICYVYIDDIIIFGKTLDEHLKNLKIVLETLRKANFKIQPDKCEFLKTEVEFLGFIVSEGGLKPNMNKVECIRKYPEPKNLKDLRAFLGLSGYYRRFVKDYAKIAKPLTKLLRGEDGHRQISKNNSKNFSISLDEEAKQAFQVLKEILSSNDILAFPDFDKPFILTTDASDKALGAVLSQNFHDGERPITFISRTLSKTEENYATNEKEMLAVVWALHSLRNFIYGAKLKIFTDHLPLTFTLSPKNNNAKLKRWKAFLEEHDYEMHYKPGKSNVVADALSRIQINSLTPTQHSGQDDDSSFIPSTEAPINVFRNQLIFVINEKSSYEQNRPFERFQRHIFSEPHFTNDFLKDKLKEYLIPGILNGIKTDESTMGIIQEIYKDNFNPKIIRARFSQKQVQDIEGEEQQLEEIKNTHNFAHRNAKENSLQLIKKFYFPGMSKMIQNYVKTCEICKMEKYDRNPQKYIPVKTPIPKYPSEIVHIDIFLYNANHLFISSLCKFSKFLKMKPIKSKSIADVKNVLLELLYDWDVPSQIVIDNESSFVSNVVEQQIKNLGIQIFKTPVHRSETNGQVERCHSTIREIARCIKALNPDITVNLLIQEAVHKYNNTIHSFTKQTPKIIYTGDNPDNLPYNEFRNQRNKNNAKILELFKTKEEKMPNDKYQIYEPNSYAYEKACTNNKRKSRYNMIIIKEDHDTYVIDSNNRKIHKTNLRKCNNKT